MLLRGKAVLSTDLAVKLELFHFQTLALFRATTNKKDFHQCSGLISLLISSHKYILSFKFAYKLLFTFSMAFQMDICKGVFAMILGGWSVCKCISTSIGCWKRSTNRASHLSQYPQYPTMVIVDWLFQLVVSRIQIIKTQSGCYGGNTEVVFN